MSIPGSRSPSVDTQSSAQRPVPTRDLSYTHVFPSRRAPAKPASSALPSIAEPPKPPRVQAHMHHQADHVSTFHGGLDWLIEAAVESEPKRRPMSLRGDALTEDSLRKLNRGSGERTSRHAASIKSYTQGVNEHVSFPRSTKSKATTMWSSSDGNNTSTTASSKDTT